MWGVMGFVMRAIRNSLASSVGVTSDSVGLLSDAFLFFISLSGVHQFNMKIGILATLE